PVRVLRRSPESGDDRHRVVYLPSCATRMFGADRHDDDEARSVMEITLTLLDRAGFAVVIPERVDRLCCGMAFRSKGQFDEADHKGRELNRELLAASENGRYPILCDTSPCTLQMQEHLDDCLTLHEPVAFAHDH